MTTAAAAAVGRATTTADPHVEGWGSWWLGWGWV